MKIGLVGDKIQTAAWEQRLQKRASVNEVVITGDIEHLGHAINACILLNPSETSYDQAALAVRKGYHVFLVSKLPVNRRQVERLYHYAEESRVGVQLAHWATFNPASQWILNHIKEPETIHIERSLTHSQFKRYDNDFRNLWIEDIALILKLIPYNVHRVDASFGGIHREVAPQLQLFIRFDNGSIATLFVQTSAQNPRHIRFITGRNTSAEHNVAQNELMVGRKTPVNDIYFEHIHTAREEPADRALSLFLKSVQMKEDPVYSVYDGLKMTKILETIEEKIYRPF